MSNRVLAAAVLALAVAAAVLSTPTPRADAYAGAPPFLPGPSYDQNFPDPAIIQVDGVYHAYSTSTGGAAMPHLVSTDLVTWTAVGDAMDYGPVWSPHPGFRSEIWAPSVLDLGNGDFVAVYAVPTGEGDRHCLSVAYAPSPSGPFRDDTPGPPLCENDPNGALDPFLVRDDDGIPWVIWKNEGVPPGHPTLTPRSTGFWARQLSDDVRSWRPGSTIQHLLDLSTTIRPWQGTVIENPAMIKWEGSWILTYSANRWDSDAYAIGWARCDGPAGPCSEPSLDPLATSDARRLGPGGQTPVIGPDGTLRLGYHAWNPPFSSYPDFPACDTDRDGVCADQGQRRLWVEGLCVVGDRAFLYPPDGRRFCDVDPAGWYSADVEWLWARGLTAGLTPSTFGSDDELNRAQMVTFLWRYSGEPTSTPGSSGFDDVDGREFYAPAVDWSVSSGITVGVGPGRFGPDETVTRAQMATFLWRLAGTPPPRSGGPVFDDLVSGSFYETAVLWLAGEGITTGVGLGLFAPEQPVSRAQMAAFLHRYDTRP